MFFKGKAAFDDKVSQTVKSTLKDDQMTSVETIFASLT